MGKLNTLNVQFILNHLRPPLGLANTNVTTNMPLIIACRPFIVLNRHRLWPPDVFRIERTLNLEVATHE